MKDEGQLLIDDIRCLLMTIQGSPIQHAYLNSVYLPRLYCSRVQDIARRLESMVRDEGYPAITT